MLDELGQPAPEFRAFVSTVATSMTVSKPGGRSGGRDLDRGNGSGSHGIYARSGSRAGARAGRRDQLGKALTHRVQRRNESGLGSHCAYSCELDQT